MHRKVLIISLIVMSSFSMGAIDMLAHAKNGNNEVKVQKIGEFACILNYVSGDYLTTEGTPIFYTFQVEVADGEIQKGMLASFPHSIKTNRYTTLTFHDSYDDKMYEYSGDVSQYGQVFYSTNLFGRFLRSNKIIIRQGSVAKKMPIYSPENIPYRVKAKFQSCVNNLDGALQKYCASSASASAQCEEKRRLGTTEFPGLIIKIDPDEVVTVEREK